MKLHSTLLLIIILISSLWADYPTGSPVSRYGKLKVIGTQLCNESGDPVQLRGVSSHGLQWFGEFMHEQSVAMFANEWKVDLIRASMYTAPEAKGYIENPDLKNKVIELVNLSEKYGIYCIIDWHMLSDNDPNEYKKEAKEFFSEMTTLFKDKKHVIYEICNEPDNKVTWSEHIKPYAEELIPVVQNIDPKAIVLVGTTFWCQDLDVAAKDPIDAQNIMYTLHFYAGEHGDWVKNKYKYAVTKIPIFVSEFGTTMADGDQGVYLSETNHWLRLLHENKTSWVNWSVSNKNEDCAILKPGTAHDKTWEDDALTASGLFIKNQLINGFNKGPYTITIKENDKGTVELSPQQETYNYNDVVTFNAIPKEGFVFHSWRGLVDKGNPSALFLGGDIIVEPVFLQENEKIVNGNFEDGHAQWKFVAWGDAQAEYSVLDGKFTALIEEAGKDPWEIQFEQKEIEIEKNGIYRLAFTASAVEEREITCNIGMSQSPWNSYSDFKPFTIGPESKTYRASFKMTSQTDDNARIFFDLGEKSNADVTISNVSLIDTTELIPIIHENQFIPLKQQVRVTPTTIELQLSESFSDGTLSLFTIKGKELLKQSITSTEVSLTRKELSLSSGIYFLKVRYNSKAQYHTIKL